MMVIRRTMCNRPGKSFFPARGQTAALQPGKEDMQQILTDDWLIIRSGYTQVFRGRRWRAGLAAGPGRR